MKKLKKGDLIVKNEINLQEDWSIVNKKTHLLQVISSNAYIAQVMFVLNKNTKPFQILITPDIKVAKDSDLESLISQSLKLELVNSFKKNNIS
jgi:hypothetical protein